MFEPAAPLWGALRICSADNVSATIGLISIARKAVRLTEPSVRSTHGRDVRTMLASSSLLSMGFGIRPGNDACGNAASLQGHVRFGGSFTLFFRNLRHSRLSQE
jgi:hypothetical protein